MPRKRVFNIGRKSFIIFKQFSSISESIRAVLGQNQEGCYNYLAEVAFPKSFSGINQEQYYPKVD